MITKRISPCLDVKDGRVVKGVNFQDLTTSSSPVELGRYYSENGADELVFYDITASAEGRALFTDILTEVARTIFIPLTVGGGINTIDDFDRVLNAARIKSASTQALSATRSSSRRRPQIRRPVRRALSGRQTGRRAFLCLHQRRPPKYRYGRH